MRMESMLLSRRFLHGHTGFFQPAADFTERRLWRDFGSMKNLCGVKSDLDVHDLRLFLRLFSFLCLDILVGLSDRYILWRF